MIPVLESLSDLTPRYDVLLCDVWGVLHNGVTGFPPAVAALQRARAAGTTVILVTNAPRPMEPVKQQLAGLGVAATAFDAIATSGDVTRDLVDAWAGRPLFHLGPPRDASLFQGLTVNFTPAAEAEVVVCTGLNEDTVETPADYEAVLQGLAARKLPFICANPDIVVERGHQLCYCAGALAARYAELGGTVAYAGKPHMPIYGRAVALAEAARGASVPKSRMLAIGDGLTTDMAGASAFGIDALFIPSAVSLPDGPGSSLEPLFDPLGMRPVAMLHALV